MPDCLRAAISEQAAEQACGRSPSRGSPIQNLFRRTKHIPCSATARHARPLVVAPEPEAPPNAADHRRSPRPPLLRRRSHACFHDPCLGPRPGTPSSTIPSPPCGQERHGVAFSVTIHCTLSPHLSLAVSPNPHAPRQTLAQGWPTMCPPLGAVAVLLFASPAAIPSKPYNVAFGFLAGSAAAYAIHLLFG